MVKINRGFSVLTLDVFYATSFKVSFAERSLNIPISLRLLMNFNISAAVVVRQIAEKKFQSRRIQPSFVHLSNALENTTLRKPSISSSEKRCGQPQVFTNFAKQWRGYMTCCAICLYPRTAPLTSIVPEYICRASLRPLPLISITVQRVTSLSSRSNVEHRLLSLFFPGLFAFSQLKTEHIGCTSRRKAVWELSFMC